jgi:cytochrome P450
MPVRGPRALRWYVNFFRDPVACLTQALRRYGPVACVGNIIPLPRERLHVLALGPDYNRQILGDPATFVTTGQVWPGQADSALRRIRYGLTRMNGQKHRQQRRLIMPLLSNRALTGYWDDLVAVTRQMIEDWPTQRPVDIWRLMRRLSIQLATQILFGGEDPDRAFALSQGVQELQAYTFSPGVWVFPFDLPGTPFRAMHRSAERVERILLEMIADRRARPARHSDMLALLVRAHDAEDGCMTDTDLLGQAFILFAASYENVANTLTWTVFLLAQHPHILADLHDELEDCLGDEPASLAQLESLPLLDAVVQESMRVLTPVPYLIRAIDQPVAVGAFDLKKGDRVVCSPYITHHLPDLFPEPQRFLPQRWFDKKPGPYEYLPFGAGPRLCIGYSFAMTEIKLALAMILKRWRLSMVPGARVDRCVEVMMKPKYGMPMTVHPQDRRFRAVPVTGDILDLVDLKSLPRVATPPVPVLQAV